MAENLARWALESVYGPSARVGRVSVEKRINSTRLRVDARDSGLSPLFIKATQPGYQQGHLELGMVHTPSLACQNQNMFQESLRDPIRVPRAILSDDARGLLVTEFVEGLNLKSIMSRPIRPGGLDLAQYMKLAGKALAGWHRMTTLRPALSTRSESSFDVKVRSFLDFSIWNILINRESQVIYVVDFPGCNVSARRHRDLATFLHSLLVTKLHPMVALNPRPWWSWQDAYSVFLESYAQEAEIEIAGTDYRIVQEDLRDLVQRELGTYQRVGGRLRHAIERTWYARLLLHPAVQTTSLGSLLQGTGRIHVENR